PHRGGHRDRLQRDRVVGTADENVGAEAGGDRHLAARAGEKGGAGGRAMLSGNTAHTHPPPPGAPASSPNLLIDPLSTCGGPAGSGANVQAIDFCDPMMKLMPPEMSQVSTPARTRWAAAGSADAMISASAAAPTA